jgi:uncharacterized protein
MIVNSLAAVRAGLTAFAIVLVVAPASAQQPSANTIALAKDILTLKGAANLYDPIIPGVIEKAKGNFLVTNPMLSKDLNEVAAKLRAESTGRAAELANEVAKLYASRFTEQELKDVLAFYKTPAGRKVTLEEPRIIDASVDMVATWQNRFGEEIIGKFRTEMKKRGHDL